MCLGGGGSSPSVPAAPPPTPPPVPTVPLKPPKSPIPEDEETAVNRLGKKRFQIPLATGSSGLGIPD